MNKSLIILFLLIYSLAFAQVNSQKILEACGKCELNCQIIKSDSTLETFELSFSNRFLETGEKFSITMINNIKPVDNEFEINNLICNLFYNSTDILSSVQNVSEYDSDIIFSIFFIKNNNLGARKDIHAVLKICGKSYIFSYFGYFSIDDKVFIDFKCMYHEFSNFLCL